MPIFDAFPFRSGFTLTLQIARPFAEPVLEMAIRYSFPFGFLAMIPLSRLVGPLMPWAIVPAFVVLFLVFDAAFGSSEHEERNTGSRLAYRMIPWAYIPVQLATILWGAVDASQSTSIAAILGLATATGGATGIFGMLAAHEMIHSRARGERALGLMMLAGVTYMHFRVSHLQGHHRLAATPADSATARRGESVYRFVLRSITGQLRDTWRWERDRTADRDWPLLANRLVRYAGATLVIYAAFDIVLGWRSLLFQGTQSAIAILVLELFDYVAHYGLLRRALPGGGAEPLAPWHSWNTTRRFSNWCLLNGGHHSAHHRAPARVYQDLRPVPSTPRLPFGYAGTMLLALVPPLWRRVMDRRLQDWRGEAQSPAPPVPRRTRHDDRAA